MTTLERETTETHLRGLEKFGYDVKAVWREFTRRIDEHETGKPGMYDLRYTCPTTAPSLTDHLEPGNGLRPGVLSPHTLWSGYHYTLTPGQRKWFREFTGMTPAQTVTIGWLELWTGTQHPKAFKLISDLHVDPRHRKHVITEWVVREAGEFFTKATEFDNEEPIQKTLSLHVGPCKNWTSIHKWAASDLSGVKLEGKVEVTFVDSAVIHFADEKGRAAKVDRDEFLSTVADYSTLHKEKKVTKKKDPTDTMASATIFTSMEDMMADLEKGLG